MIYLYIFITAFLLIFPIFLGMLIRQQYTYDILESDDESAAILFHLYDVNKEWLH